MRRSAVIFCLFARCDGVGADPHVGRSCNEYCEIIGYVSQIKSSLESYPGHSSECRPYEYSEVSEDLINAVLGIDGSEKISWFYTPDDPNGNDIVINISLGLELISMEVNLEKGRCHEFSVHWVIPN